MAIQPEDLGIKCASECKFIANTSASIQTQKQAIHSQCNFMKLFTQDNENHVKRRLNKN